VKPILRVLLAALAVGAPLLGAAAALRRDPRVRNWVPLPADMVLGPAAQTQDTTTSFADGRVQRRPPAGTVARGTRALDFRPGEEEAKRAGKELGNPVPDSPEARARGEAVWRRACVHCHGLAGKGDAPVTLRGFPPPPDLHRPESRALADGEMFHAITFGRKNMPSAALQVETPDRWCVIRYVRTLQEAR
jgi:mono/diheme cytochrome c family protein